MISLEHIQQCKSNSNIEGERDIASLINNLTDYWSQRNGGNAREKAQNAVYLWIKGELFSFDPVVNKYTVFRGVHKNLERLAYNYRSGNIKQDWCLAFDSLSKEIYNKYKDL